ncbi:MAG: hypothetical protein SVU32_07755, partial [Candidatus Nanohaloarchaea archaeon]|nr:hypothetical protein [Candidatus Nanohaloarchaea archaeon]
MEFTWLRERLAPYSARGADLFRIGLGVVMIGAGAHQYIEPATWAGYMAPFFARLLSGIGLSPLLFMQVNG